MFVTCRTICLLMRCLRFRNPCAFTVLPVRISDLVDPANRIRVGWEGWSGPAFRVGDFVVWGFTGGVLDHLLEGAGWAEQWDDGTVLDLRETLARSANRETFGMDGAKR